MGIDKSKCSFSTSLLLREAEKRKISYELVYPGLNKTLIKLKYGRHEENLFNQFFVSQGFLAFYACKEKQLTKAYLKNKNINIAEGLEFGTDELERALEYFKSINAQAVVKPSNETHGRGVFLNVNSVSDFRKAWSENAKNRYGIIIEKMHKGEEYRILATRKEVVGITKRIPANVIGDGKSSVEELINIKNQEPRRKNKRGLAPIIIDKPLLIYLEKNKLNLDYVPEKDEQVFLRSNSNLSSGGDSVDYTDNADKSVADIAISAVNAIPGLEYCGLDFLTENIAIDQAMVDHIIVEINASPMISMHHYPMVGTKRDVTSKIFDIFFKETKSN